MAGVNLDAEAGAREAARELVLRYGWNAAAYQVLNAGMRLWFSRAGDAVIGYATHARTRVVAGAPICPTERLASVAEEFERDASEHRQRVMYFGAGDRFEQLRDPDADTASHRKVLLGAQPVWDAANWPAIVQRKASLRAQLNRARNKGVRVAEWSWMEAQNSRELRAVLHGWLATRGLPPLRFMTEPEILSDLRDRRVFVAKRDNTVIGFLVTTPVPARNGWLVEQWPRAADAPNGTTHLLVDAAMRGVADSGARFVTLGLAPLSERTGPIGMTDPVWLRAALRWVRAHGRRFYNFRGLEAFKASLEPKEWEPVYAIAPGHRLTPRMLLAIAGVFGGGSPEALLLRGAGMAIRRELSRLTRLG
jgi:phosphatidylglycerol lysyltransferase